MNIYWYFVTAFILFYGKGNAAQTNAQSSDSESKEVNEFKSKEYELANFLLEHYNKAIRPSENVGDLTYVFVELSLFDILELNTKEREMYTNTEFIIKWVDYHLTWEPIDYDNITTIRMPWKNIWVPDIVLYNTAKPDYQAGLLNTNVIITSKGVVELVSHALFSSICNIDIQWYPFDQQTCALSFASWTYDESELYLILGPADISQYNENPEYFLEDFYADQVDLFNPCCEQPMSTINYYIQLQRRTKFSVFFFVMPGIMINICGLLVFSLPFEAGEKMTLGISSMLAMTVFLMEMTTYIPPTEKIPLIGVYFGLCIILIAINIASSVAIMNFAVAGMRDRIIPLMFRTLTIYLIKIFGNNIPEVIKEKWNLNEGDGGYFKNNLKGNFVRVSPLDLENSQKIKNQPVEKEEKEIIFKPKNPYEKRATGALDTITKIMKEEEIANQEDKEGSTLVREWKLISRVYDRFLFYSFSIIIFLVNVIILPSSPYGERFDYCPVERKECEGMTKDEIMEMAHSGAGHAQAVDSAYGGGH